MKKLLFLSLTISFALMSLSGFSQISKGGSPLSFTNQTWISSGLAVEVMPAVDVQTLMAQDSLNDIYKDVPWRFGENIPVNLDLNNSGTWDVSPDGDKIWRLGIRCNGAYSINLTFDNYRLPPGATLFVYNFDKTQVIGAFTDFNNREDREFATTLLMGEQIVIEYYEPSAPAFTGELHLNRVTHGYRDAFSYIKSFGQSGSCNNNVNCPEAAGWEKQVRSACMLVTGGNGFCSGSLVNNTNEDGIPYVLTANHCYSSPSSWVFWFNWQSATCPNPTSSPSYNSISGATLKARFSDSDFCLVQMSSTPPVNYNVYYSGWNKKDTAATSGACVHHPSGDIKKISYVITPFTSDTWSGTPANSHWKVNWSDGVTEGGSSGSPMYDQYHHVVGQLHGGPSSCSSSQKWDFYGKFSMSWDRGTTPGTRLKDWLDPTNIAGDTLGGYDPIQVPAVVTLAATDILTTSATLNATVDPNGIATSYFFEWGLTSAFGNTTSTQAAGSGSAPVAVSEAVVGLTAETPYFFRVVGTTSSDTLYGNTLNFVTPAAPYLSVLPQNQNVGYPAGNTQFLVSSNIAWAVTSDSAWCTVTSFGTGNDTLVATFTENTSVNPRVAPITIDGASVPVQVVTVTQAGAPVILNVSPPNQNVASSTGNTSFYVTSNTDWTVSNGSGWVTVTPSGTGNDSIHVTFTENITIVERVATLTVSAGTGSVTVTVTQAGAPVILSIEPVNQNVTYPAGNTSFAVTSNTDWSASSDAPWCTITTSGSGNGTIVADYLENPALQARIATISVTVATLPVQTVTVSQAKSSVGIDEQAGNELRIYPNPTNGHFRIIPPNGNTGELDLQVIDLHGRVIMSKQLNGARDYEIDLTSASAGSYEIKALIGNNVFVKKLVIIKK